MSIIEILDHDEGIDIVRLAQIDCQDKLVAERLDLILISDEARVDRRVGRKVSCGAKWRLLLVVTTTLQIVQQILC